MPNLYCILPQYMTSGLTWSLLKYHIKNQCSNMISEMSIHRILITESSLQVISHGHYYHEICYELINISSLRKSLHSATVYDKWSHMLTVDISYKEFQWSNMVTFEIKKWCSDLSNNLWSQCQNFIAFCHST